MTEPKYIVGIDLGTTHCVLAYTPISVPDDEPAHIRIFNPDQVVSPGEVDARPMLPSFLFLPGPHDVPEGGLDLPWCTGCNDAVGEFARRRGAELPQRLVASAKSWLCHAGVDRTQAILPWDAPEDGRKVSPVDASARFLSHLAAAWNHEMATEDPQARLEQQDIYLTVPASFDAVARELTVQAARNAGLEHFTLLEEPQAAFYAWLESEGEAWRKAVKVGESILVCDMGGGTTDLSLIQVTEEDGSLQLKRVAVGEHILLGGDNMDLTLAHALRAKLSAKGTQLDSWQFRALWHACRSAKESLLGETRKKSEPVTVVGRGSSLIGGTIKTDLTRDEVQSILLDGFFPVCGLDDHPQVKARVGVREMGLPYASDPAVTRHLARFLSKQATDAAIAFPSIVLFNGGVTKSPMIRDRLMSVLGEWSDAGLRQLESQDLDLAVARGAAYYGLARRDRGIRIKAGIAHTYYIGIESAMPAVPGIPTPMKALCVAPFGMEEGTQANIRTKEFGLVIGEPAVFHLMGSRFRKSDPAAAEVEDFADEIEEVTIMESLLPADDDHPGGQIVPVWLESKVTEVGTLELWCVARDDDRRWKLEFNLKERDE